MTNEVRVGNWVFADGVKVRVTPIMIAVSEGLGEFCLKLTPIPLTPEIFQKIKEANGKNFFYTWTKDLGLCWEMWDGIDLPHIQHVHQLQNFYYMAENKELIVEL